MVYRSWHRNLAERAKVRKLTELAASMQGTLESRFDPVANGLLVPDIVQQPERQSTHNARLSDHSGSMTGTQSYLYCSGHPHEKRASKCANSHMWAIPFLRKPTKKCIPCIAHLTTGRAGTWPPRACRNLSHMALRSTACRLDANLEL